MKNINESKSQIINELKAGFNMMRRQKERTAQRLGKKLTVDSCAYAYVLYDEMASYLIRAELPEEDLQILQNCPGLYARVLEHFLHNHEDRYIPYANCIKAIIDEEKKNGDVA